MDWMNQSGYQENKHNSGVYWHLPVLLPSTLRFQATGQHAEVRGWCQRQEGEEHWEWHPPQQKEKKRHTWSSQGWCQWGRRGIHSKCVSRYRQGGAEGKGSNYRHLWCWVWTTNQCQYWWRVYTATSCRPRDNYHLRWWRLTQNYEQVGKSYSDMNENAYHPGSQQKCNRTELPLARTSDSYLNPQLDFCNISAPPDIIRKNKEEYIGM